jgi:nucleoid DNA-binding protein
MRKAQWGLAALVLTLAAVASAQVPGAKAKKVPDFKEGIAKESKLKVKTVDQVLKAFGPAIQEQLMAGRTIDLPGVGTFRVVRVNAYRDLINGIPGVVPARNYVEFVPVTELNTAANAAGAVPARTVEGYQFRVNPNSAPGNKVEDLKVPRGRTTQR